MEFYFDPLNEKCKSVRGGVREGQPFRLRLFCTENGKVCMPQGNAFLLLGKDGERKTSYPLLKTDYGWTAEAEIAERGLYFYCFYIENVGFIVHGNRKNGRLSSCDEENFLLTVSSAEYFTPDWLKGGVIYQIFPDRFCKTGAPDIPANLRKKRILRTDWGGMPSYRPNERGKVLNNDFFGGNLQGIRSKLPYLQSLGITAIYLNPIFEAASNHRYDTSDYMKIDPLLGTEEDLRQLITEAEKHGIRLILDGVFNHTGDDSVYFNKYGNYPSLGAYQSKDSPYFSWYTFQQFPDRYSSWWGIDILPEVNENSEDYQEFIFGEYTKHDDSAGYGAKTDDGGFAAVCNGYDNKGLDESGVLKKWLSFGIGGYRLDVADELPDFFLRKLRKSVKEENPEAIVIGEVWEDASDKISYSVRRAYLQGDELDSVMNYPFKNAIVAFLCDKNSAYLAETVANIVDHYPKATLDCLMNILGTHDTARILTVLGGKQARTKDEMASDSASMNEAERFVAVQKLKIAALLLYTLPGVPCTYYGDEIGMEGFGDPFCRRCFDESEANTGLTDYYRRLGAIRKEYADVFTTGKYEEIYEKSGCFVFVRRGVSRSVYTCVNLSSEKYSAEIDHAFDLLNQCDLPQKFTLECGGYWLFSAKN